MTRNFARLVSLGLALHLLAGAGCAVHIPEPDPYTSLEVPAAVTPEAELLDVAIAQFTFAPPLKDGAPDLQTQAIRKAESRYMPVMLRHNLAQTGAWGGIYVLPETGVGHDVRIEGAILDSEPHTLRLRVAAFDATGTRWFERIYTAHVGDEVHGDASIGVNDPFDGIYNRIANDMLAYRRAELDAAELATIRQTAELQFGKAFAPDVYGSYLVTNRRGITGIARLPPANDPAVMHLAQIHQRDRAFQEVLQQHYVDFARGISDSYFQYRRQGYRELQDLKAQQREAQYDVIGGAVWLGVAVATSNIDDAVATLATTASALAGAAHVIKGVRKYATATPFIDELADSFAGDVATEVVTLDEDVVTLSGTTESIYGQWKEILAELFREDRSLAAPTK